MRPRSRRVLLTLVSSLFLLTFLGPLNVMAVGPGQASAPRAYPAHVPGEILIRFKRGASPSDQASARALVGGQGLRKFKSGAEHWMTGPGITTETAIARLRGRNNVEYVEPNYIVTVNLAPNDPSYSQLWGLHNTGQTGGTPGADIDAELAWDMTTGTRTVLVGVIDTGIDYNHPDLAANIWANPGEIPGNHVDDDHNGYVDDVRGWDFVNNDNDPFDDHYHGTHVAGTIGALGNNGVGVSGVAWQVSLVALKFLDEEGFGSTANAIRAVDYATAMRLDMTNNSWGGGGFSQALLDSIRAADAANVVFVASAGNDNTNTDISATYPVGYDSPNIIAVAASGPTDSLASFSNYGHTSVDLSAPGVDIYSASPSGTYRVLSGTSMAAPHVTGVAALLRSVSPGLPVASIKSAIMSTVDPIASQAGRTVTGGRLNASRAISSLDQIPPGEITDLVFISPTSSTVFLGWTATGDDGQVGTAAAYDVRYSTSPIDETNFSTALRAPTAAPPRPFGSSETFEVPGLASSTSYYFAVKALDDGGHPGPISNVVTGTTLPPPTFASSPADFALSLFTGESTIRPLTIANVGVGTLDWSIPTPVVNGIATIQQTPMVLAKGQPDPRIGGYAAVGARGPDAYGYRFADSDEPGGPVFSWYDLTPAGTAIPELDGDDQISEPIPLGFGFPFYGETFDTVRVSTNGFLSFTSSSAAYTNQPLPSATAPETLIALFWDDLDFSSGGRAVYSRGQGAFILQFVNVRSRDGSGTYTFGVILRESGEIMLQYLSMAGPLDTATVGIQDGTGTADLQAVFNAPYIHDNMALSFSAIPQWLSASPTSGRLFGGESQDVTIHFDAAGLVGGTYPGSILVQTNDPLNSSVSHPVTLTVTDAAAIVVSPLALDFGTVFVGYSSIRLLNVLNTGTTPLTADLVSGDPSVTFTDPSVNLVPGGQSQVGVNFSAAAVGAFASVLTISSNAPNAPLIEIPLTASAIPTPDISVTPSSYSESLLTGGTLTRVLSVTNTGGSDLVVNLATEASAAPQSPALLNGGFELGSFIGWTATSNHASELLPWTVSATGGDYFEASSPSEGIYDALNGFDGEAGLVYDLYHDIQVPAAALGLKLEFDDRIQYDSLGIPSSLPRIYEATIENPGGTVLATIVHEEIRLNGRPYTDLGWRHRSISLAPFAGQTIRLHIHESIPETYTGPASIEFDAFRIEGPLSPDWLGVLPPTMTIPPGATQDFAVTFEAGDSETAVYSGAIRLETNIPATPILRVPAILSVTAAPDIVISGEPVTIESTQSYATSGGSTSHALFLPVPPVGEGSVELIANGDYGVSGETATATAEGTLIGTVGNTGTDCTPVTGTFTLSASQLTTLAADDVVDILIQNSSTVDVFCSSNSHTVRLTYEPVFDRLDFGSIFLDLSRSLSFKITNLGKELLHITSVSSSLAEFTTSPLSLSLAPGESVVKTVIFTPSSATTFNGTLTIASNDPDTASVSIPLTGTGLEPPVAGVSPASLESTLLSGTQEIQRLTLSNTGGSPLNFTLSAAVVMAPAGMRAVPFAGLSSPVAGASNNPAPASGAPAGVSGDEESYQGVPGDFEPLRASPLSLTCIVEDRSSGLIYGQADGGTAFFRYRVATDTWESLAAAPINSGNNGGAALLNGRVYTSYTQSSSVGVYDIATNSWSTIASPLDYTANIASDGSRYLYFVVGVTFARFDPVTSVATILAPPPFLFEEWGGMRHLSGVLYAHQGNGLNGFASYDVLANTWTLLPAVPSGAVLGAAIDELKREYYAYGDYEGQNLYRYSIDTGTWSVATIPFFTINDGGLGWLASPGGGVYFVEGEGGTGFARVITAPGFVRVSPATGTVPASGSIEVEVTLDARSLFGGVYRSDILVSSNDPIQPQITVPATLTVIGAPEISVAQEPVIVGSTSTYTASGFTSHALVLPSVPAGDGTFTLIADGDYGESGETATATAEGTLIGSVGSTGTDCALATAAFPVSASQLATLAADGVVLVNVQNASSVGLFCPTNQHTIRLSYDLPSSQLDFGSLFLGVSRTIQLVIANNGTDTLHVTSISSSQPEFTPSVASLDLAHGTSQVITITFRPLTVATFNGMLTIASNDPDTASMSIPLTGTGLEPPVAGVSPASLESTLFSGTQEIQRLTLSNTGGSPLNFTLSAAAVAPASVLSMPFAGLSSPVAGASNNPAPPAGGPSVSGDEDSYLGVPGDFEPLRASPVSLTCVVEDRSSGLIYAQANQGTAFYRYRVATDTWESLATAPIYSGNNGGAALLNGRIYTSYTERSEMGVYDIATNSWTFVDGPMGYTANIASDGSHYLYFVQAYTFVRFDPVTSTTTVLPLTPFYIDKWGGIRHLSGVLYAHQGNGQTGFASYDVSANTWAVLPSVPSGAVLGAAIDPQERVYYAYGSYDGRNLYRYSIDARTWSVATIPFFIVSDGGLGWLPSPVGGVYFVQGEYGTGFARLLTALTYVRVSPATGTVPASGSIEVEATFDAQSLLAGVYRADILVSSNDPIQPRISVPATLTVVGVPDISIAQEPVIVESTSGYTASGLTSHTLVLPSVPAAAGVFTLIAAGDYGDSSETATATAEGTLIGSVGGTGTDCGPATGSFPVPASQLATLAADGVIMVNVQSAGSVGLTCSTNQHTIRLSYDLTASQLDFGSLLVGESRTIQLVIANKGTDTLHVTSISSSQPEFTPSVASLDLAYGTSQIITMTFMPLTAATFNGTLTIASNDPDTASMSIPLTGTGLEPPIVEVQPSSIDATVFAGNTETRTLTISNNGLSALNFTSKAVPAAVPFPGAFEPLRASPASLTCVVEDRSSGLIYAQANQGNAFFRYRVATDMWEPLAFAPIHSGNNGGAALLNGRIYTSYTDRTTVGVYNIATNSWATIAGPIFQTANIASDGSRYLYFALGFTFVRFDPVTSIKTVLPQPPFSIDKWGGMRYLSGVLYAHQGNGQTGFASYDVSTNTWAVLPAVPSGAVLGAAIDPQMREYYAYGNHHGRNLYRYSIDTRTWSVATIPNFILSDGGLASLGSPVAGIYFVQGDEGTGFARVLTAPEFVQVSPATGSVAAGASTEINVQLDGTTLAAGQYDAVIEISSNDPITPKVTVPVSMTVFELPNMVISAQPISLLSVQGYSSTGARTSHLLMPLGVPDGDGTLEVVADGNFATAQSATVTAEGVPVGSVGGTGSPCASSTGSFTFSEFSLDSLVADGIVRLDVQNQPLVSASCPVNRHTLRLTYPIASDHLDFGSQPRGFGRTLTLDIRNTGGETLHITSITSSDPEFVPSVSALEVAPGMTTTLSVTFTAPATGAFTGLLTLESDDYYSPHLTIPLNGTGVEPPVLGVLPTSLLSSLLEGMEETRTLTLTNTGAGPLNFVLNTSTSQGDFLSVSPSTGIVPPAGSVEIAVHVDARPVTLGYYTGIISVSSNDPSGLATVPVTLTVSGVPVITLSKDTIHIESSKSFVSAGGHTTHTLILPEPIAGNGSLDLIANGRFRDPGNFAIARIEGTLVGSVVGTGGGCGAVSDNFVIPGPQFAGFAADGVAQIDVQNSIYVTENCPTNTHTVGLNYHRPITGLDHGQVIIGGSSTREFFVENTGSEALYVDSISSDSAAFVVSPTSLALNPASAGTVLVTFLPTAEGTATGTLTFLSNDTLHPSVTLPVMGTGSRPPLVGVEPASLSSTLRPPDQETQSLTIRNSGQLPLSFSITVLSPELVSVTPSSGVVSPAESMNLSVHFDSSLFPSGLNTTTLEVVTNDPVTPIVHVPVSLYVVGPPILSVQSAPVTLTRTRPFSTAGARTTTQLSPVPPPASGARLDLTATGDFGDSDETATASAELIKSFTVGGAGGACSTAVGGVSLSRDEMNTLLADGVMTVTVQNSAQVAASCAVNRHVLSLTYRPVLENLDFGSALVAQTVSQTILIENQGTSLLTVTSVAADRAEFRAVPAAFTLPPGESQEVTLQFTPSMEGDLTGTFIIESDAPVSSQSQFEVSGLGLPAPVLSINPAQFTSNLVTGHEETRTLIISNTGAADLEFTAVVVPGTPSPFLSVAPDSGTVPAGESLELSVRIDAATLPVGNYTSALDILTNDPMALHVVVPVTLTVAGLPDIALSGEEVTVSSVIAYTNSAARTVHHLAIPVPPASAGSISLTAEGHYGDAAATADAILEGIALGTVGALGGDCGIASGAFPIDVAALASFAEDGNVDVTVQNSADVTATCPSNRHTVVLTYRRPADLIQFGNVFIGHPIDRSLVIENRGSTILTVESIATDRAEFEAETGPLSIAPGGSATMAITLTAGSLGPITGSLLVSSNDPDSPSMMVALAGTAVVPPTAGLSPDYLSVALPPGGITTRSLRITNTGGSVLTWTLGGPGTSSATPMPPWIVASSSSGTLAAGAFTDISLNLAAAGLPDGDHEQTISLHSNDPVHTRLDALLRLHVGEVAPDFLIVEPAALNLSSNGPTVKASIQLPAPFDPHNVLVASVKLNGLISPIASKTSYADENLDGRQELILKFDRAAFEAIIPQGQSIPVSLTGEVQDQTWFRGTTTIRMIRPGLTAPNGGEYMLVGQPVTVQWSPPPATGSVSYTVLLSRDGGSTWENLCTGLTTTACTWIPSGVVTSMGRIRVLAYDNQGVMGYDTSDADFTIAAALTPPHGVSTLEVQAGVGSTILLAWTRPGTDTTHGPVHHYRVMRSFSASTGFVEIGAPAVESFNDPAPGTSQVVYYYVLSVNAAGESND